MPRRQRLRAPTPTADASMRLERLSADPVGGVWYDLAGSNNGTPSDPAILVGFVFDGVADHIDTAGPSGAADPAADWTVTAWVARDHLHLGAVNVGQTRSGLDGFILGRDTSAAAANPLKFEVFNPYAAHTVIPAPADSDFHHVAWAWDADGGAPARLTVHVDGVQVYSSSSVAYTGGAPWVIGGDGAAVFWKGKISSFRVYPRLLSADELARDYQAGRAANQ